MLGENLDLFRFFKLFKFAGPETNLNDLNPELNYFKLVLRPANLNNLIRDLNYLNSRARKLI